MNRLIRNVIVLICIPMALWISVFGSDLQQQENRKKAKTSFRTEAFAPAGDIAFISVWGSRPDAKKLKGFERAVLYNARGELVKRIDIGRDSVYSLDKMIQENKARGPLFIRMYR